LASAKLPFRWRNAIVKLSFRTIRASGRFCPIAASAPSSLARMLWR
jgi:hypothetical protein